MDADARAQFDSIAAQSWQLDCHLDKHAQRIPDRDNELCELGIAGGDERIDDERRGDDDVVENRGGRRPEIIARSVEQAAYDGRYSIEHDLHREESEEEDGIAHRRLVVHEALRVNERGGEYGADERHDSERDEGERQQIARVFISAARAKALLHGNVYGQKRRYEHAADHELVEHIGQIVRHLVGACQHGRPQREGHGPRSHEARDARDDNEDGDKRGRRSYVAHAALFFDGGALGVVCGYGIALRSHCNLNHWVYLTLYCQKPTAIIARAAYTMN